MQLFLFSLKMSITTILIYWCNDTPSFVTWRSRLATAPYTPTCIVIHGGQFTSGVHPSNQFVPEIVSPLPCSPALVRHALLFLKELISFIGSLDKYHTSVSNALIFVSPSRLTWFNTLCKYMKPLFKEMTYIHVIDNNYACTCM